MLWKRIIADIILFASFFLFPFWITFPLFLVFLFFFDYYVEGVLVFFLADLTFGVPLARFHGSTFILSLLALFFFALSLVIRPHLFMKK